MPLTRSELTAVLPHSVSSLDIHFQYNGMLIGILLLSLAAIRTERNLEAAFWFAVLLNFKHIFLYVAPIYGIYLLRVAVLNRARWWDIRRLQWVNIVALFVILAVIFGLSLGPFVALGQIPQLISRLFPFKRGLVHAYWAPNAWALYMGLDLVLARVLKIRSAVPNSTSGLVGSTTTMVLPNIPPWVTLLLTVLAMAPLLWKVWNKPTPRVFLFAYIPLSLCSFLFGWHVHEKAILITLVPFGLLAFEAPEWTQQFLRLSLAGHFALVPLFLEESPSYYILYFLIFMHWFITIRSSDRYYSLILGGRGKFANSDAPPTATAKSTSKAPHSSHDGKDKKEKEPKKPVMDLITATDVILLAGIACIAILNSVILPQILPKFEFLPLLITSVFASVYVVKVFIDTTMLVLAL